MYPPLAAALPGAGAQLTTWGESCDLPLRAAMLPWERQLVDKLGSPLPGATSAKRFRNTVYDPAWPQDTTDGNFWTVYPGRQPDQRYGKAIGCKGDSGGPTFAAGEIAFVSSQLLVMGSVHYPENGNPPSLTYFVDGIGFAEVPKWRGQLMDKISEWSYYCGSAGSGTSSGSASDSGSSGGSGGSGSSICLTSYAAPTSGPFSDDMPLSSSGAWVGDNWLSFTSSGSNDTFTELCVLDGSGTLGVGSECQYGGGDSGSGGGAGDSGDSGAGGSGSGYSYGDSSSGGGGGSGSGYSSGDSSYSDSGYGYCVDSGQGGGCSDSGSGGGQGDSSYSDSGSGGGYGDSGYGGSGGGYGDSGSGGAGGEGGGDGGDGGGGGGGGGGT